MGKGLFMGSVYLGMVVSEGLHIIRQMTRATCDRCLRGERSFLNPIRRLTFVEVNYAVLFSSVCIKLHAVPTSRFRDSPLSLPYL